MNLWTDLREELGITETTTLFDVGANIGDVTEQMRFAYPEAEIHAFEPIQLTYAHLRSRNAMDLRTHCHQLALGVEAGETKMSIAGDAREESRFDPHGDQVVAVERGDQFCEQHGIERIDVLKIDAEGQDLNVLRGFGQMLEHVSVLQVEAAWNGWGASTPQHHISFEVFDGYLGAAGFELFRLYDQSSDTRPPGLAGEAIGLAWCNAVFMRTSAFARRAVLPVVPEIPRGGGPLDNATGAPK